MSETARFQETLRRLAMVDEAFVADQAGLGLEPAAVSYTHLTLPTILRV